MTIDPFIAWSGIVSAGLEMQKTWLKGFEMLPASQGVIAARSDIMRDAVAKPFDADLGELGRMMPEKVAAFSTSIAQIAQGSMAMQLAGSQQMQRASAMLLSGRVPTLAEASALASQTVSYALGAVGAGARLGKDALAPIHRTATGNARRLAKTKTNGRRA